MKTQQIFKKEDVLAYLVVLGCKHLSYSEHQIGTNNIIGCLERIVSQARQYDVKLAELIEKREHLNGRWWFEENNEEFDRLTQECNHKLYNLYLSLDLYQPLKIDEE
jgi:hypothetical protein